MPLTVTFARTAREPDTIAGVVLCHKSLDVHGLMEY